MKIRKYSLAWFIKEFWIFAFAAIVVALVMPEWPEPAAAEPVRTVKYIPAPAEEEEPAEAEPPELLGEFIITAYCPCERCCGQWANNRPGGKVLTASGEEAEEGVTIAADWDVLPAGSIVYIAGVGVRQVQDKGGAIQGNRIDVYFSNHEAALQFGRQVAEVYGGMEG